MFSDSIPILSLFYLFMPSIDCLNVYVKECTSLSSPETLARMLALASSHLFAVCGMMMCKMYQVWFSGILYRLHAEFCYDSST